MEKKVSSLLERFGELEAQLSDPAVLGDKKRYKELSQEHAYLSDIRDVWTELEGVRSELRDAEGDAEMRELLAKEIERAKTREVELAAKLQNLLVPPDPDDHRNTILELRAGTGGDEAALFVGDCVRMYKLFADSMKWKVEQLSCTPTDAGGYKEYVMVLSGRNVHRFLQYEGGTHRVQRVPVTETQGRIHTSAITVAVLLEPDEEEDFVFDDKDLRIETCRASGAGGQHVNTTDSAIRIVHLPTGLVATCQDERSQIKNKDKALRMLKAKIVQAERDRKAAELASARAAQVGSGDRSERIRTYNFPQNRITDHRINYTRHNLDRVMDGDLAEIVETLVAQQKQ